MIFVDEITTGSLSKEVKKMEDPERSLSSRKFKNEYYMTYMDSMPQKR